MQAEAMHIHTEDGSHLYNVMGTYAVPHPDKQVVQPPISVETKGECAHIGFNHPQLRSMLCPVKYLKNYIEDFCAYIVPSLSF